jgi:hypothetical protein
MQTAMAGRPGGRAPRIIGLLLLLVATLLLLGAGYAIWSEIAFRRIAVETDGRVVEMIRGSGSRNSDGRTSVTYRPAFVFSLPNGKEVRAEGSVASNPPCCRVGDRVRVRYDPARPENAALTGFMQSWLVASILGGMGAVFAVIGLVMRRVMRTHVPVVLAEGQALNTMTFAVPLVGLRRDGGMRWILQARWSDPRSGVQRLFESEPLPFDPVPQMRGMSAVNIAFDPGQPEGPYWMDLTFLREPDADATVVQRRG